MDDFLAKFEGYSFFDLFNRLRVVEMINIIIGIISDLLNPKPADEDPDADVT